MRALQGEIEESSNIRSFPFHPISSFAMQNIFLYFNRLGISSPQMLQIAQH
jgi:hypothetical protein